mmetsp:Transcript_35297/g.54045  ORF Transcript_35297/g.54045 Transcript_35297/m.54045 type:complete len:163 (-) Transcript_35297:1189-1677(-)
MKKRLRKNADVLRQQNSENGLDDSDQEVYAFQPSMIQKNVKQGVRYNSVEFAIDGRIKKMTELEAQELKPPGEFFYDDNDRPSPTLKNELMVLKVPPRLSAAVSKNRGSMSKSKERSLSSNPKRKEAPALVKFKAEKKKKVRMTMEDYRRLQMSQNMKNSLE